MSYWEPTLHMLPLMKTTKNQMTPTMFMHLLATFVMSTHDPVFIDLSFKIKAVSLVQLNPSVKFDISVIKQPYLP